MSALKIDLHIEDGETYIVMPIPPGTVRFAGTPLEKPRYGVKLNMPSYCKKEVADICLNCTKEHCSGSEWCFNKAKEKING